MYGADAQKLSNRCRGFSGRWEAKCGRCGAIWPRGRGDDGPSPKMFRRGIACPPQVLGEVRRLMPDMLFLLVRSARSLCVLGFLRFDDGQMFEIVAVITSVPGQ
jgi:hypothetical protein